MRIYKNFLKRILDLLLSSIILLILLPVLVLSAFLVYLSIGENPFFIQERPGKNSQLFKLIKLKTMNSRKDSSGNLLPDKERLTKLGIKIRKWSIDEIPQLLNVIEGEMSLVGPRPLLLEYLQLYNNFQSRRQEVKPGITGLAQINGRNQLSWPERFEFDVWYVDNVSFLLDIKIVFKTIINVFLRKNIEGKNSITMNKFEGN